MSSVPDSIVPPAQEEDPLRFGWRMVQETDADGVVRTVQRGLTREELLHPEEGDVIVQTQAHHLFVLNLAISTERLLLGVEGVRYRVDHRIDWGHESIRPHAPDVIVFDNGQEPSPFAGTINLSVLGNRPLVAFEVTSPATRANDLETKVEHYYEVGVPVYIIVDLGPNPEGNLRLRLIGYQAGPDGYEPLPLDEQGRLHVEPIGLVLAIEGDWLFCYDEQGNVLADRTEIGQRLHDLETQNAAQAETITEQADEIAEQAERIETIEGELVEQIERTQTIERQRLESEAKRLQAEAEKAQAETAKAQAEATALAEAERARQAEIDRVKQTVRATTAEQQVLDLQTEMIRMREELARLRGAPGASGDSAV